MEKCFYPPAKQTAVEFPGFDGGAEWGGPSYDPQTGLLYVNANEMGWLVTMSDVENELINRRELCRCRIKTCIKNIV